MAQAEIVPELSRENHAVLSISAQNGSSVPRAIWFITAGIALRLIGGMWDVSWHASIGLDTFWAPPHILIHLSAVVVGVVSALVIVVTTFVVAPSERPATVEVLGLYAPAGAFVIAWGCLATLTSAPFDNWWHQAYGDISIATPPHLLLALGYFAMKVGAMVWIASVINRSTPRLGTCLKWLFLFVGSIGIIELSVFIPEPGSMHTAACYLTFAVCIPTWLIACGWGSAHRWGTTIVAGIYTGILVAAEWLLPLFPAQPKLGPVYHKVTHLIPTGFPLLLIVPAFVADLILQRIELQSYLKRAVWLGPALVISFLAVQWPFANFLISPASRNWIFGTAYFAYSDPAGFLYDPFKFDVTEKISVFLLTIGMALAVSMVTAGLGLAWGNWMRGVRR